ncbi:hypothetical protein [Roseateles sp.]|uniref:hypothetical protein n=1 Tax=Roseateles sp. TaxID=1971397 RepID=UPI002F3E7870
MRDPEASLQFEPDRVVRHLNTALPSGHFLHSDLARQWVERGDLVSFQIHSPTLVSSRRLPFVTHPYEWTDSQLFAAAQLTLRLQQEAVDAGFDLKDASAWNVIFDGTRPIFCDLMSFQPLCHRKWWAAGQFNRHFLYPLLLSMRRGFVAHQAFLIWRDGMPDDAARQMLGWRRFLGRHWLLMVQGSPEPVVTSQQQAPGDRVEGLAGFRSGLHSGLKWMLDGVRPDRVGKSTVWRDYISERSHYDGDELEQKRQTVSRWLNGAQPQWVLDLGCNSGEFSRLAVEAGASVIAADGDHGALQRLWREPTAGLHPLLCRLDDLAGGRGWEGREHPGLLDRLSGKSDVVMMLALIHHLMVSASIPLTEIARFVARCSRRWAIVEMIEQSDVQLRTLCAQRQRTPDEFVMDRQIAAFEGSGFEVVEQVPLAGGHRRLMLLRRREG